MEPCGPARNVYVLPAVIGVPKSTTDTGSQLQNEFNGTEKPAVAVAVRFLLLPRTEAANETPTGSAGVVTFTKRIFAACPFAEASPMYGPLRLTANSTLPRGKVTPV